MLSSDDFENFEMQYFQNVISASKKQKKPEKRACKGSHESALKNICLIFLE